MDAKQIAFNAAFDGLIDAETQDDAAAALAALRDATDGADGLRLALYDAFGDEDHAFLDGVAAAAVDSPATAAGLLLS
ncbi:hypothetical protein [Nocardioides sp. Arc9.136]|uniref:hypothetical protein n=1 Tax=Nocardioides sp. Arc9.136 TaxID=2996826 RepID=UPI00266586DF|nr:hypothetical protein [Nocardioides sp. Arc9.136]WKN48846.1 hypothetical protein OSR43_01620 [Nocardioides sp. Arc9.136]